MDQAQLSKSLGDQYKRCLHMFRRALEKFSDAEWRKGEQLDRRPAALAYHTLETIDFYTGERTADEFPWGERFGADWETDDPARLPSLEQIQTYLQEMDEKLARWLEEADFSGPETVFKWTGRTTLERGLYLLRHTQHHVGELSRELNFASKEGPAWR